MLVVVRALTLIRPMAGAIVHGSKRIENRPRNLPAAMRGVETVVAVHAGKAWSDAYWDTVARIDGVRASLTHPEGIIGLMRLSGRVFTHTMVDEPTGQYRDNNDYNMVMHTWVDGVEADPGRWYSGPFGYEIKDAVAFDEPVACRGMQGWWPVPDGLLARLVCSVCGWHHPRGGGRPIRGCVLR